MSTSTFTALRRILAGLVLAIVVSACSPADPTPLPPLTPPPGPAPAPVQTATLAGEIWEMTPEGRRPVPGAQVRLCQPSCRSPRESLLAVSDGNGRYEFSGLARGLYYEVTATNPGHDPATKLVRVDGDTTLDIQVLVPFEAEITVTALAPLPGASLSVGECLSPSPPGRPPLCSDDWQGTFEVAVNRDVQHVVLTIGFYDGATLCAHAAATIDRIAARTRVSLNPRRIVVAWERGGTVEQPCQLPVTTTRLVAILWSDAADGFELQREFPSSYTFVKP